MPQAIPTLSNTITLYDWLSLCVLMCVYTLDTIAHNIQTLSQGHTPIFTNYSLLECSRILTIASYTTSVKSLVLSTNILVECDWLKH